MRKILLTLLTTLLCSVTAWADCTYGVITAASATDLGKSNTPRYVVNQAGVGRLMKNETGSSSWSASDGMLQTGSSTFALQTYNAIDAIFIYGSGTGANRTLSSVSAGAATNSYSSITATARTGDNDDGKFTLSGTTDSMRIDFASTVAANYYIKIVLSGNINITSVKLVSCSACTSHSVTAATSTGNNTYGTVAAASASVCEGSTTTVTATPASGYQVTNWAVSGTGASASPSGASNSNTTTLTMGTADATVTVTFGCKAPTSPSISGTTAYTEGQDISLSASASDKSASATYTWYKGATWDAASATTPVQAASTSGASLSIADCVEDNAGTYWCEISNGTGCDTHVSKAITVTGCTPSISASPSSADYCKDDVATALSFTGSGHNAQKWQYYDGDSWEDIDGATSTTYTPSTSATGSTQYRVVTTCDSYTTTATSSAATITVKTSPNLTITLN